MGTQPSLLSAAGFGLAVAFIFSCSSKDGIKGDNIANYATKQIGDQVWMAENSNYAVEGSKCYGEGGLVYNEETRAYDATLSNSEIQANCAQYGRLYDWATAMALPSKCNNVLSTSDADCAIGTPHQGICPSGWHIPSNADWDKLFRFADGTNGTSSPYDSPTAGRHLKATSGWHNDGDGDSGDSTYGFAALPGGYGSSAGNFSDAGYSGVWWSSSERDAYYAYRRYMYYYYEDAYWDHVNKGYHLFSVRCLKN
jgi:uncharacterized protein (TIGR02145 family)